VRLKRVEREEREREQRSEQTPKETNLQHQKGPRP
jgi:hypothetical protein